MTNITFHTTKTGDYRGFTCEGHAGYADYGQDIVCASISVLVINTINSLEDTSKVLMDSLVLGLTQIEKQYGKKHCKLTFEEV